MVLSTNTPTLMDSEERNAPWNQPEPQELEVTVSITLSKTVKIKVDMEFTDTDFDLESEVREQVILPNSKGENFTDWNEDDFNVIVE